jgi:hypothetical protein
MAKSGAKGGEAPQPVEAAAVAASGDDRVCVAVNLPRGISYMLGKRMVTLAGSGSALVDTAGGRLIPPPGTYGLTMVDKADWEEIVKRYGESVPFKAGLIFSAGGEAATGREALGRSGVRHGYEPSEESPAEGGAG